MALTLIVGSGRSGTHMLARALSSHPELNVTLEIEPLFTECVEAFRTESPQLVPGLIKRFESLSKRGGHQVNKTHPSMHWAKQLKSHIHDLKFVYIRRNPLSVVSSMLEHKAISKRLKTGWRNFSFPNKFLHTGNLSFEEYSALDPCERGALCWLAAEKCYREISDWDNVHLVSYADLVLDPKKTFRGITNFLGILDEVSFPAPRKNSLEKYKSNLSIEQIRLIREIITKELVDVKTIPK